LRTFFGRSTVSRPAKLPPVPGGTGIQVTPLAGQRRVCPSASLSWCVTYISAARASMSAALVPGRYTVAVLPAGVFPQSIISSSTWAPAGLAAGVGRTSNVNGMRCDAGFPGFDDETVARLRWASLSDDAGVSPVWTRSAS
jgi:hypothetical protein